MSLRPRLVPWFALARAALGLGACARTRAPSGPAPVPTARNTPDAWWLTARFTPADTGWPASRRGGSTPPGCARSRCRDGPCPRAPPRTAASSMRATSGSSAPATSTGTAARTPRPSWDVRDALRRAGPLPAGPHEVAGRHLGEGLRRRGAGGGRLLTLWQSASGLAWMFCLECGDTAGSCVAAGPATPWSPCSSTGRRAPRPRGLRNSNGRLTAPVGARLCPRRRIADILDAFSTLRTAAPCARTCCCSCVPSPCRAPPSRVTQARRTARRPWGPWRRAGTSARGPAPACQWSFGPSAAFRTGSCTPAASTPRAGWQADAAWRSPTSSSGCRSPYPPALRAHPVCGSTRGPVRLALCTGLGAAGPGTRHGTRAAGAARLGVPGLVPRGLRGSRRRRRRLHQRRAGSRGVAGSTFSPSRASASGSRRARPALLAGYRFVHLSNAHTAKRNPGLNAHLVYVGIAVR